MARWTLTVVFFVGIVSVLLVVLTLIGLAAGDPHRFGESIAEFLMAPVRGSLIGVLFVAFYVFVGTPVGLFLIARWLTDRVLRA